MDQPNSIVIIVDIHGENTAWEYISFASQISKESGYEGFTAVPDRVWLQAEDVFAWQINF